MNWAEEAGAACIPNSAALLISVLSRVATTHFVVEVAATTNAREHQVRNGRIQGGTFEHTLKLPLFQGRSMCYQVVLSRKLVPHLRRGSKRGGQGEKV